MNISVIVTNVLNFLFSHDKLFKNDEIDYVMMRGEGGIRSKRMKLNRLLCSGCIQSIMSITFERKSGQLKSESETFQKELQNL